MRLAVITDIHGNLEALREVLSDIDRSDVDRVVSLGDNVGYGPQPEEVLHLLASRNIPSVMGNHELAIVDRSRLSWFNPEARRSIEITRSLLSDESLEALKFLSRAAVHHGCLCVHGFPPDSVTTYLFDVPGSKLIRTLQDLNQEICFVGHTHQLVVFSFDGTRLHHSSLMEEPFYLPKGHKGIINAGSVGQPRDGDNRAKYVIWDDQSRFLEVRYVSYNIARTARLILDLGFPGINASRLW